MSCHVRDGWLRWDLLVAGVAAAAADRRLANRWPVCRLLPAAESVRRVHRGADSAHQPARARTQTAAHLRTQHGPPETALLTRF